MQRGGGIPATRKIDTWASNGPTKTDPTGTRQQKRMHIMNGWTRRRRNGCQKYIASVHPLSTSCTRGLDTGVGGGVKGETEKAGRRCRSAEKETETRRKRKRRGPRKTTETERSRKGKRTEEESEEEEEEVEEGEEGGGSKGRKRRIKLRSSRIPPFICLCDEEQARPARQKISKIRRVARGTVCPGAQSRIYKERSHDLCRDLGYLSISMVHAISLHGYRYVLASNSGPAFLFFPLSFPLSFFLVFLDFVFLSDFQFSTCF